MHRGIAMVGHARRCQVGFGLVGADGTFTVENVPPRDYILDAVSMDINMGNSLAVRSNNIWVPMV